MVWGHEGGNAFACSWVYIVVDHRRWYVSGLLDDSVHLDWVGGRERFGIGCWGIGAGIGCGHWVKIEQGFERHYNAP